jgi:predicted permease
VWWDVRYALRQFRRNPGFTAVAVAMLALGIAVNATVFTLANTILFKGFPFIDRNDRILYIHTSVPGRPEVPDGFSSYADFEDWRAQSKSFAGMAYLTGSVMTLSGGSGFPANHPGSQISANTFQLIGQRPLLGRDFAASDETPDAAPVVILSHGLWQRRYGADPALVGQAIRVNGVPTTVIGVMPAGFFFPYNEELWTPMTLTAELRRRDVHRLWLVFGRLADGVPVESARTELTTIGRALESAYPTTNRGAMPIAQTYNEHWVGARATRIYESMWGAVACVLLIACANLANLLLARALGRSREMAVRIALGASRWRIVRQLIVESLMLSTIGGVLGWLLAKSAVGIRAYELAAFSAFPLGAPAWFDFTMDSRVLVYLMAISVGTGLVFGLAPALRLSTLNLKRGTHMSALLVIGEMAIAVVLLAAAGVMIRSYVNVATANIGVRTDDVLTASLSLPAATYHGADAQISFFDRLAARLDAIPGVESVAIAGALPTFGTSHFPYAAAGAPALDDLRRPRLSGLVVSPSYFRTLGVSVLSGRAFTDADSMPGVPVAVVNERFASSVWPGENVLGKRLRLYRGATPEPWLSVVGVVSNVVQNDTTRQGFEPLVYLPYRQRPAAAMNVAARTRMTPENLAPAFRREIQAIDADLPIAGPVTLTERVDQGFSYRFNRSMAVLFVTFAGIALLLASVGLYAVLAHAVTERTQEIGIRMAIGASANDILSLVLAQGLRPLGIGLAIGLGGALAIVPILRSALVQVAPTDPLTLAMASATCCCQPSSAASSPCGAPPGSIRSTRCGTTELAAPQEQD